MKVLLNKTAITVPAVIIVLAGLSLPASTQESQPAPPKTLAANLEVYAFPQKGQSSSAQAKDEGACYTWAVENTGSDPFQLQKKSEQQAMQTEQAKQQAAQPSGRTVGREVVKAAAVGTLIGGISGNEGKGAAYGAAAGLIRGTRRSRAESAYAAQNVEAQGQQAQQATAQQIDNFKKAFSVCLESKGYSVKY